jgi:dipeptidyl aminopeptidase/acylaminoacyl peptidase
MSANGSRIPVVHGREDVNKAPYGTWPSPLSPAVMGGARVSMAGLQVVGDTCWWSESRPHEGGRMVVMRLRPGARAEEVSPPGVSVRSRVHEYGGGAHFAEGDSLLYTDLTDQALWWLDPGAEPVRLTPPAPEGETHRYADARPVAGGRFLVALRERHHPGGVDDEVVAVDRRGQAAPTVLAAPSVLVAGHDFFAAPRPSPDGRRLAWLAWDHPNMPWDGTELWVADLDLDLDLNKASGATGSGGVRAALTGARRVAGGPDESVGQPTWDADDLWFVSDAAGWWQPYRWRRGEQPRRMAGHEVDFAGPDWALGQATLHLPGDGHLVCQFRRHGRDHVGLVDLETATLVEVAQPGVAISGLATMNGAVVVMGSTATAPPALLRLSRPDLPTPGDTVTGGAVEEIHRVAVSPLDEGWVSSPEELTFPTEGGTSVPVLFFAPRAPGYSGPPGTAPPLMVLVHGGPTAGAQSGFDAAVQLWTTRGVAVAVVDYRGSSGHGRRFRRLLDGAWGVADVEDCQRMVVKGSSAGGLTALRCLDAGGPFAAAVVAYGVTDLGALAADTHKFESRYIDRLVGPWPEAKAVYDDRSPACHPERVEGAVLLLQGADDPIVPPDQAERMVTALRARGVRCDHVVFPGEGHGFRRAETLTRCAELEMAFVTDVLGLDGPG